MATQYVTKVYGQRTSLVTSIPIGVRARLGLKKGGHLVWQVDEESNFVQILKVVARGNEHDRGKRDSDQKDKGGGA